MKIEIWSDVMCPFCYIGKKNLEEALSHYEHKDHIDVIWKSYQLDPTVPEQNDESYIGYLSKRRNVTEEQGKAMLKQVEDMAKSVGLEYHFDKAVMTNSFNAHRLIQLAKEKGKANDMEERLFKAYFTEGKDIANKSVLDQLGNDIGLTSEEIETAFSDDKYAYEVKKDINEAMEIGVTGVPFFVADRKYGVSGAQPASELLKMIDQSYTEWSKNNIKTELKISQGDSCDIDGKCD